MKLDAPSSSEIPFLFVSQEYRTSDAVRAGRRSTEKFLTKVIKKISLKDSFLDSKMWYFMARRKVPRIESTIKAKR
jgi:hypothetical protein